MRSQDDLKLGIACKGFPPPRMQLLSCRVLNVAQYNVRRLTAARLHNGESVEACDHHVLRSTNTHGVAGDLFGNRRIQSRAGGRPLNQAPNGRCRKRAVGWAIEVQTAKEWATKSQACLSKPTGQQ